MKRITKITIKALIVVVVGFVIPIGLGFHIHGLDMNEPLRLHESILIGYAYWVASVGLGSVTVPLGKILIKWILE